MNHDALARKIAKLYGDMESLAEALETMRNGGTELELTVSTDEARNILTRALLTAKNTVSDELYDIMSVLEM